MTRMAATRDGYGQALLDLADNPKVVVLEADLGKSTKSLHFRKAHPERTVSCGIGEQNMQVKLTYHGASRCYQQQMIRTQRKRN